jgi:hypothetical protein
MVNLRYPVKNLNSNKATGFRGNLHFPVWDDLTAGFTFYNDSKDTANGNAEKFAQGVHGKARYQDFTVQIEYAIGLLDTVMICMTKPV